MSKFEREEKNIEDANGKDAFNVNYYYFTKKYRRKFDAHIKELQRTIKAERERRKLVDSGNE